MRTTLALLALVSSTAIANATPISLSATDVSTQLRPYADRIEHCYLDRTTDIYGAGTLSVELTVSKKGELRGIAVKTPGLATQLGVEISNCIVDSLANVSFPARRTHTTATIPYFFQRTAAPGAGPQESCWNADGCPTSSLQASKPSRPATRAARYTRVGSRR